MSLVNNNNKKTERKIVSLPHPNRKHALRVPLLDTTKRERETCRGGDIIIPTETDRDNKMIKKV